MNAFHALVDLVLRGHQFLYLQQVVLSEGMRSTKRVPAGLSSDEASVIENGIVWPRQLDGESVASFILQALFCKVSLYLEARFEESSAYVRIISRGLADGVNFSSGRNFDSFARVAR